MKNKKEIKNMRMQIGKFLHNYYVTFGEEKYDEFIKKLGPSMEQEYGEPFNGDNLRIMEAEFVTFNSSLNDKKKARENSK